MSEEVVTEAETRERLSELVDRTLAGEDVRITRDGAAVVASRTIALGPAAKLPGKLMPPAEWEWLRANRVVIEAGRMPEKRFVECATKIGGETVSRCGIVESSRTMGRPRKRMHCRTVLI